MMGDAEVARPAAAAEDGEGLGGVLPQKVYRIFINSVLTELSESISMTSHNFFFQFP